MLWNLDSCSAQVITDWPSENHMAFVEQSVILFVLLKQNATHWVIHKENKLISLCLEVHSQGSGKWFLLGVS